MGLGLAGLAFYLWIIHSYKLPAGDIAVLALALGTLTRGAQIRFPPHILMFAAFIAWAGLSISVSDNPTTSIDAVVDLLKLWVISFCIINVVRTPAELRFLTIAWLALFALYPIRGALHTQFICGCPHMGRASWNFVFSNPNDLAALCLIPMSAAGGIATLERNKLFRWAAALGVGVIALVIMLTQSRGAMLALGVGVVLLPVFSRRRARDVLAIAVLVGAGALLAPKGVWERLSGLSNASVEGGMAGVDEEGSAEARWQIWQIALAELRNHPVTGIGIGMMPEVHRQTALREGLGWEVRGSRDTHSTYLKIAAETGYPGLVLYLMIWLFVFAKLRRASAAARSRQQEQRFLSILQLGALSYLTASIFGTYGSLAFTYLFVSFLWLAADILQRSPWYVPEKLAAAGPPVPAMPLARARRGART